MYTPWIVGAAIFIPAMLVYFVYFESRKKNVTLSRAIFDLGVAFPLSIFILGHLTGGLIWALAVHFFWHWCPDGGAGLG